MDFHLSEEHQMLLDTADKIARDFPRAYYVEHAKAQTFPQAQWDALAHAGILGVNTPEAYGGSGMGMLALVLLQERLAEHGVAPLFFVVNQGIAVPAIWMAPIEFPVSAWYRGAKGALAAGHRQWGEALLLRHHRAQRRHQYLQDPDSGRRRR